MARDHATVAVVGSGPSGLSAAFRLRQAGYRVRLFDSADYIGGKLLSYRRDGFVVDRGALMLATNYDSLLRVIHDAGLDDELVPGGDIFGFARDRNIHYLSAKRPLRDSLSLKLISNASKLKLVRMGVDLARLRGKLSDEDLSLAADFDTDSAGGYGRRHFNKEIHDYVLNPTSLALAGSPADEISQVDFLYSVHKFIGARYFAFRDGMDTFPLHLSKQFECVTSAQVVSVEEHRQEVVLTWRNRAGNEHIEHLAGCVLAIPAVAQAKILRGLDDWRAEFLSQVSYAKMISVALALGQRHADPAAFIQVPKSGLVAISVEHNRAPYRVPAGTNNGLLTMLLGTESTDALMEEPDDVVIRKTVEMAEQIIPRFSQDILFGKVTRWAPVVLQARPGHWRNMRRMNKIRAERDRLVQLAGDYFATSNVNTASTSGERAARELLAVLAPMHGVDALAA